MGQRDIVLPGIFSIGLGSFCISARTRITIHNIRVKLIHPDATLPSKMSAGSAGYDLYATEPVIVPSARTTLDGGVEIGRALIPTGVVLELPVDTVGRIASRSGLSVRSNIETGAGWIDSDYRGELFVELKNLSSESFHVNLGDRIAQLVILQLPTTTLVLTDDLNDTPRGLGGFGSTGI